MCGIVGVIGKIGKTERDVFRQLLIVDSLRGADSTGFVSVKGNRSDVFKRAGDPYFVMESNRFDKTLLTPANVLIGHNRFATVGAVNSANAHPFDFEDVVGVHNGTLRNKYALPDSQNFTVDSENLYHAINKEGVEATIPKVQGAWSLVWWNKKQKTVNFLRNDERPMCFCISKDKKTLFFASEVGMLSWILFRNRVEHEPIVLTAVDHLYSLVVKDEFEGVGTPLDKFSVKKLEGKPVEVFHNAHGNNVGNVGGNNYGTVVNNLLNKRVEFEVVEPFINPEGARFILGVGCDDKNLKVLVSVENDKLLEEELMDFRDDHIFVGYGQSIRYGMAGGPHLLLRKSSITSIPLDDGEDDDNILEFKASPKMVAFPGFDGKALSMIEWRDLTEVGCAFCSEVPTEKDTHSILWMDDRNFVCAGCKTLPQVTHFIKQ